MSMSGVSYAARLVKRFGRIAMLMSLAAPAVQVAMATQPPVSEVWELREIKVFTKLSGFSAVTAETYNQLGGQVEINVDGRALNACPGGLEKLIFTWNFNSDMSRVANGTAFAVNLAGKHAEAGACAGKRPYSALSKLSVAGSKGAKSPLSDDENKYVDPDRFYRTEDKKFYVYASESQTTSSTAIALSHYPTSPSFPVAWFELEIGTRAGDIVRYVYVYQSSRGGGVPGPAAWGPTNPSAGLNGTNLTYYPGTTPEQCQADCAKNPSCRGFTLIRPGAYNANDPAMCYLMSQVTSFAPSPCCISAIRQ